VILAGAIAAMGALGYALIYHWYCRLTSFPVQ